MTATFGRYRLDRVLGRGGMGVVHAAHDTVLGRDVALKIVAPHLAGDPEFRARFQHEAEVLARLDSHRIVSIHDHGEHDGSLYIVTQLVEGGDLQRLVAEQGALSPALAVEVGCQVLEGLDAAHAVGVVHRDIKPANVLLRQRHGELEAFLCDFGIAAAAGGGFTVTGGVAGSLPYMAPERHQGEDATPASDVYAVGCLLWQALTGSAPYAGTDVEVAMAHIECRVRQLPGRDDFSRRMNVVLARAMAKDPRKRHRSARAMTADLRPLLDSAPGAIALPDATAIRRSVVRRRRWAPAAVGAGSVLAMVAILGGVVWLAEGGERPGGGDALPVPATLTATIAAGDDMLIGNQVTLAPRPARVTRADGEVALAPPPSLEGLPTAAADRATAPRTSRPRTSPTRRAPAPTPVTSAAAPSPRYECWNGARVGSYADCTVPTGAAGADWIFSVYAERGCSSWSAGDARVQQVYRCRFGGDKSGLLSIYRFASARDARGYLGERMSGSESWASWSTAGQWAGYQAKGTMGTASGTHYRQALYYAPSGAVWGYLVDDVDAAGRDWAVANLVQAYSRAPGHLRGVPL